MTKRGGWLIIRVDFRYCLGGGVFGFAGVFTGDDVYLFAFHSLYFKTLFLGKFEESEKSEIELKDIGSWDFQNFLDLIYGEAFVDDDTVMGILKLADMYDSKTARFRCQDFLIEHSSRSLNEKFQLSLQFKLDGLKKKFLSEVKTYNDLRYVIPSNHSDLDTSVWEELFLKSMDLLLEKERKFGV
ncbi:Protein CBG18694 [Caenorhabditis briggsae]|uniref:Protein CBG18694 n=1 Tax=Caenorhabditis briggsae TaxID=6238 RepID=A8XTW2_CAEBR|nr:Protein CBG18694 [Caenorhabditis briggsae]CAP36092.1 Protein CBG18694 [Caenorhabditis briggsae]